MTSDNDATSGALAAFEFGQQHGEQQPQGHHRSNGTISAPMELHKMIEGSLEVKLPTIWTDEKQSRAEAERRGRLEERRSEEKE